jgi:hypothetical protein
MVVLAEVEIWHSRPVAPTRRVALGEMDLPVSPAPGFGGLLLAGIVADSIVGLDPDLHGDLLRLTRQLERGERIPQPRLRHRFQVDLVGLSRSHHRLLGEGERIEFDLHVGARPAQSLLGAVYAAGQLPPGARGPVMRMLRRAVRWTGAIDGSLVSYLTGSGPGAGTWDRPVAAIGDPVLWAMGVLGWPGRLEGGAPDRSEVQRRFRDLLRAAHPDSGGHTGVAAERIAELSEARRILLAS